MAELPVPDFLAEQTEDAIYEKMRDILPADIDSSEGSHVWNFLRPTALVLAELYEAILPRTLGLIFPSWSYGEFLDAHAKARGLSREGAVAAEGYLSITVQNHEDGSGSLSIPAGTRFAAAGRSGKAYLVYEAVANTYLSWGAATGTPIPKTHTVDILIRCAQTGETGNAAANTITEVLDPITGVLAVTNPSPINNGADGESDASLIARIESYDKSQGVSYVGSAADYRRWAKEVPGVGDATIVSSDDGSGKVTIYLTNAGGGPADLELVSMVRSHIMRPADPAQRLAPVNANVVVTPAIQVDIDVKAEVYLDGDAWLASVLSSFRAELTDYLQEATQAQKVLYSRIAALLSRTPGVSDFQNLTIGVYGGEMGAGNISLTPGSLALLAANNPELTEVGG